MVLTPDEILTLTVPELGLRVLRQMTTAHDVNKRNFIAGVYATTTSGVRRYADGNMSPCLFAPVPPTMARLAAVFREGDA